MTPQEWFDQFPPLEKGRTWPGNSQWCRRHWAPCPTLGANGMGASTELMQIFVDELAVPGLGTSAAALNTQLEAISPLCCRIGDARMYDIWGHWPPVAPAGAS